LTDLVVFLSHASIIADQPTGASEKRIYFLFFYSRNSLSINELRRRGGALPVSR